MKIAYFHYLYGSGTSFSHVNQFAAAARELGHEVTVHAMNLAAPGSASNGAAGPTSRDRLKKHLSRYLHEPKELLWNLPYLRRELAILKKVRPDVAVVRSNHLTFAEITAGRMSGVPMVLEVNAPAEESTKYYDEYMHLPWAGVLTERFRLRRAERMTVVSAALRDHLTATYGIAERNITVNQNGADPERFSPTVDGSGIRDKFGFGSDPVIGFVGSFHPWHGIDMLRAVIEALVPTGVRFMTVGEGPGSADFKRWLAAGGYADKVTFVGTVPHDEVPRYVSALDVGFVPDSNAYGSSLKLFEYMAAGKPSVVPDYAPIAEVVEHGAEALLFKPRSESDAVACLARLAADVTERDAIGQRARAKVLAGYTWRHNAQRVIATCEDAIAATRKRDA